MSMKWLKGIGGAAVTGIVMFLAAMAVANAARHKESAEKWKGRSIADAEADVEDNLVTAKAALSQAKLHSAKAKELKEKARKRLDKIGQRDEEMGSIVSGWHTRRVRNTSDT